MKKETRSEWLDGTLVWGTECFFLEETKREFYGGSSVTLVELKMSEKDACIARLECAGGSLGKRKSRSVGIYERSVI